jgi:uncharacterized protein (DUF1697 family)
MKFVSFLRGINVGGKFIVKMEDLKNVYIKLGFKNVLTVLNSGNIIFETEEKNKEAITKNLEVILEKTFGFKINIIVKSAQELKELIVSNPFNNIDVTDKTRLYITFTDGIHKIDLKIPFISPGKDYSIILFEKGIICSVLTLSQKIGTTDLMKFLEKEFGNNITTRNWNTILKIGKQIV